MSREEDSLLKCANMSMVTNRDASFLHTIFQHRICFNTFLVQRNSFLLLSAAAGKYWYIVWQEQVDRPLWLLPFSRKFTNSRPPKQSRKYGNRGLWSVQLSVFWISYKYMKPAVIVLRINRFTYTGNFDFSARQKSIDRAAFYLSPAINLSQEFRQEFHMYPQTHRVLPALGARRDLHRPRIFCLRRIMGRIIISWRNQWIGWHPNLITGNMKELSSAQNAKMWSASITGTGSEISTDDGLHLHLCS